MCSSGVVGVNFVRPRVVGFISSHSGAPSVSFGSSGVVGFTRMGHPGWLGSIRCALGVVGLNQVQWVHSIAPLGSLRSSGVRPCVRLIR